MTNKVFDWEAIQKCTGIKWWEKILLWFKKPYYGYDYGYKEDTVIVIAKKMFGKVYIVAEYHADDLKKSIIDSTPPATAERGKQ